MLGALSYTMDFWKKDKVWDNLGDFLTKINITLLIALTFTLKIVKIIIFEIKTWHVMKKIQLFTFLAMFFLTNIEAEMLANYNVNLENVTEEVIVANEVNQMEDSDSSSKVWEWLLGDILSITRF